MLSLRNLIKKILTHETQIRANMPEFRSVAITRNITSSTSLVDTGVHVTVPANSYVCLNATARFSNSKPQYLQIVASSGIGAVDCPVGYHLATGTLSCYVSTETTFKVYVKYSGVSTNSIWLSGFYITFGGGGI